MLSVPPAPVVVEYTCVHAAASLETSMWYAVANAASHWMLKPLIVGARAEVELQPLRVAPGGRPARRRVAVDGGARRRAGVLDRRGGRLGAERDVDLGCLRVALRHQDEQARDEGERGGHRETATPDAETRRDSVQLPAVRRGDRQVSDRACSRCR